MPTYEYECKTCSHSFDVFQSMRDEPLKICPKCGKELRRVINGGTGVIFKGEGFYVTDKGGKGVKSAGKTNDITPAKSENTGSAASEAAPCTGCAKAESCAQAANN